MARRRIRMRTPHASVVVNGCTLNAAQELLWRLANEAVASGDFSGVKRGMAALRALEGELADQHAVAQVHAGVDG